MNVLIYNDLGASPNAVKHTHCTLASLLGQIYNIVQIDRKVLQSETWETDCAMLVMPGGRDLPYCKALNGKPNERIKKYVEAGGRYLGLCAGAYYASESIEFEKGRALMEIIQSRELEFYPGLCRGTTYPGFIYNSENGALSVTVKLEQQTLREFSTSYILKEIKMYYNGGGYFVHPECYDNVTVLCRYKDPSPLCASQDESDDLAAAVHCRVGLGHALLIGTHPEYNASPMNISSNEKIDSIFNDLITSENDRKRFLRAAFARIGLKVISTNIKDNNIIENNVNSDLISELLLRI
ncbi:MAG: biotin-protein ligase [Benjaminiella poitrasii]|nr:MAG: biotin-protein ligase [Benjaminiella poitrasii]